MVFTKAAATVIASGQPVDPHTDITSTLDYEGEIGVIIGKRASKVSKADAMDYVWGYTLINDVTARDLQHSHKQWFIGKSLDTFCPMGPWAVTADEIDITDLQLQTRVNGELRQDANTAQLIFDVPTIIETLSAGITLEPGDVIATGTPVGVGIGFDPPKYLADGDEMVVSAAGLGELRNVVGTPVDRDRLRTVGSRELYVEKTGAGPAVVLVHGLGGATTVYEPQAAALAETHTVIRYDLSGHGRSPVVGPNSIESWVEELEDLIDAEGLDTAALVAHSMGTLVVTTFAATYRIASPASRSSDRCARRPSRPRPRPVAGPAPCARAACPRSPTPSSPPPCPSRPAPSGPSPWPQFASCCSDRTRMATPTPVRPSPPPPSRSSRTSAFRSCSSPATRTRSARSRSTSSSANSSATRESRYSTVSATGTPWRTRSASPRC